MTNQCQMKVFTKSIWDIHGHQCTRKGVVKEDGKHWCRQHAPSAQKARDEKIDKEYRRRQRAQLKSKKDKDQKVRNKAFKQAAKIARSFAGPTDCDTKIKIAEKIEGKIK